MPTDYLVTDTELTSIANAIRTKGGTSAQLEFPADFVTAISNISGGSASLVRGVIRPDATLVHTYKYDKLIVTDEGKTIPAYTTSTKTLLSSVSLSPTLTLDLANYNYYVLYRNLITPVYNSSSAVAGRQEFMAYCYRYELVNIPADTLVARDGTKYVGAVNAFTDAGSFIRELCWDSATSLNIYSSNAYGAGISKVAPSRSSSTLTIKSPTFTIRGSATYLSSSAWSMITDIRYQFVIDVYKAQKNNLNLDGWGLAQEFNHVAGIASNYGTLT